MTFDEKAFMEEQRLAAERELGRPIPPEDWDGGTTVQPGENMFAVLGLPNAEERERKFRLSKRIKTIMRERGLTQTRVAELTSLSQSDVSKIVRGQLKGFSESRLYDVIAALGFDVEVRFVERADHAAGHVNLVDV